MSGRRLRLPARNLKPSRNLLEAIYGARRSLSSIACNFLIARRRAKASHLKLLEVGNAGFHEGKIHFHKIIFNTAGLSRGEDLFPIECVLSNGRGLFGLRRPSLNVHGNETAGILRKIFGGVVAPADRS